MSIINKLDNDITETDLILKFEDLESQSMRVLGSCTGVSPRI